MYVLQEKYERTPAERAFRGERAHPHRGAAPAEDLPASTSRPSADCSLASVRELHALPCVVAVLIAGKWEQIETARAAKMPGNTTVAYSLTQCSLEHRGEHPAYARFDLEDRVRHARVAAIERRYFCTRVGHLPERARQCGRGADDVDAVSFGEAGQEPPHGLDDGVDFVVGDELECADGFQGHVSFQVKRRLGEQVTEHAALGQCGRKGRRH